MRPFKGQIGIICLCCNRELLKSTHKFEVSVDCISGSLSRSDLHNLDNRRWEMREEGGEGDDKGEGGEGPVSASPIPRAQAGDRWQLLALVRCQGLQQTKRFSWFWQRAVTHHLLFRWPDVEGG